MTRTLVWALVAVNVVLGLGLLIRLIPSNTASAQLRRPSDYLMVPGKITGASTSVVYVVDSTRGVLGGMTYDETGNELQTLPPVDLARVFDAYLGQPNPRPNR